MTKHSSPKGTMLSSIKKDGIRTTSDWNKKSKDTSLSPLKGGVGKPAAAAFTAMASTARKAVAPQSSGLRPATVPTAALTTIPKPPTAPITRMPAIVTRRIPRKQPVPAQAAVAAATVNSSTAALEARRKAADGLSPGPHVAKKAATTVPTVNSSTATGTALAAKRKASEDLSPTMQGVKRSASAKPAASSSTAAASTATTSTTTTSTTTTSTARKSATRKLSAMNAVVRKPAAAADMAPPAAGQGKALKQKKARSKPRAAVSKFAARSTGARYGSALKRDNTRAEAGKIGKSRHKFELQSREWRHAWRAAMRRGDAEKTTVKTAYGPANLSKFNTRDRAPKITTQNKHYNRATVGDTYTEISAALIGDIKPGAQHVKRERDVASELLETISTGKRPKDGVIGAGAPSAAAAKLMVITHVSEPERVGGSSKLARASLRAIANGRSTFDKAFGGDNPEFPMAKSPDAARSQLGIGRFKKARPASKAFHGQVNPDVSDSSDDDT